MGNGMKIVVKVIYLLGTFDLGICRWTHVSEFSDPKPRVRGAAVSQAPVISSLAKITSWPKTRQCLEHPPTMQPIMKIYRISIKKLNLSNIVWKYGKFEHCNDPVCMRIIQIIT